MLKRSTKSVTGSKLKTVTIDTVQNVNIGTFNRKTGVQFLAVNTLIVLRTWAVILWYRFSRILFSSFFTSLSKIINDVSCALNDLGFISLMDKINEKSLVCRQKCVFY